MSHTVCNDIGSWVDQNVQQQLEQCVEMPCNWWCLCCNKWFCALVWVVVTVSTWVVTTVCEVIADVVDIAIGGIIGLVDIIVGIFTGDWTRALGGLIEIFAPIGVLILDVVSIATLGTLVGAFTKSGNSWALRDHARMLLEAKFKDDPATLAAIKDAVGTESMGFGLRLKARALRTFIRSDFSSQPDGTPDLIIFIRGGLDLKMIAGIMPPAWWNRSWPELIGDTGNISEVDLDNYIAKSGRGEGVKQFTLFSMSRRDLQSRLDVAINHASELGLILQWTIEDVRVTAAAEVLIDADNFPPILMMPPFSRHDTTNFPAAQMELCTPMGAGIFGFTTPSLNGISAHLAHSTCLEAMADGKKDFPGQRITGSAFRYRKPDVMFKYVAIHELGHTFGLCHVDGLLRIMFTNASDEKKNYSSTSSWFQYWTKGVEAGFTLDEGKSVWSYIVDNFSPECLKTRAF